MGLVFPCRHCRESFESKASLRTHHTNIHKMSLQFTCMLCSQNFTDKTLLVLHFSKKHDNKKQRCNLCQVQCDNVVDHLLSKHTNSRYIPNKATCPICKKTFTSKQYLTRHQNNVNGCIRFSGRTQQSTEQSSEHICFICKKRYTTATRLRKHEKNFHNLGVGMKCLFCPKVLYKRDTLQHHMTVSPHNFKNIIQCPICFIKTDTLPDHLMDAHVLQTSQHTESYEHKHTNGLDANIKIVSYRSLAEEHINNVTDKKQHSKSKHQKNSKVVKTERCNGIVGKSASKRLKCEKCGKTYAFSSSLYRHNKNIHAIEQRRSTKNVSSSKKVVTEKRAPPNRELARTCLLCKRVMSTKWALKLHLGAVHNLSKAKSCPECRARPADIVSHIMNDH